MAYFSNGQEGSCFDEECSTCKYGQDPCPIAFVQINYNYDSVNKKVATKILNALIKDDGTCEMKKMSNNFSENPKDETLVSMEEIKKLNKK